MDSLKLRNFRDDDLEAFHASMSEYDVVKMTGSWPWPPEKAFTQCRMVTPQAKAGEVQVIALSDTYIGQVSVVGGVLGYMLAKPHWGKGIVSWAVAQKLDEAFMQSDLHEVTACVWHGNPASEAILYKYGFVKTGECEEHCTPRDTRMLNNTFRLLRADWLGRNG